MFSKAKVGDKVWDFLLGWGIVYEITKTNRPIKVEFNNTCQDYIIDGKINETDINPRLFWNELKFEIPSKQFDLTNYLKTTIEPKEFKLYENNWHFVYHPTSGDCKLLFKYDINIQQINTPYFKLLPNKNPIEVQDILYKVNYEELVDSLKELKWI